MLDISLSEAQYGLGPCDSGCVGSGTGPKQIWMVPMAKRLEC